MSNARILLLYSLLLLTIFAFNIILKFVLILKKYKYASKK